MASQQTQQGNMHNLTTLIKRLEAATSRLEDIASTVERAPNGLDSAKSAQSTASTATATTTAPASLAQAASTPLPEIKQAEPLPRVVEDFDKLIEDEVSVFVQAANTIGGLVDQQAKAAQAAFQAERSFLLMTTKAKKPQPMSMEILSGIQEQLSEVDNIKTENRANPSFTHLTMVAEGIIALGWVVEDARPGDYIDSLMGSAQYSGNKVLKEYKEKDPNHVKYVQSFYKVMRALSQFVKDNYKTGLTWNQKDGGDAIEILRDIQSGGTATPKPSAGGAAPPPPPPPPVPTFDAQNGFSAGPGGPPPPPPPPTATAKGGDMTAVFDQLNQGSAVTSGLRKVDKSQMTHKNPSLRATPTRSDSTGSGRSKSPMPAKKPESLKGKKPGKKELDGTKWIVENFENTGNEIIEIPAEMNHSILISKCTKCVIKVTGKATAVSVDNCTGLSILVGSLVSSIDVIKAQKFALQVDGQLPTILMDQVDGAQIYLQEASMQSPPEIVTSKCSAINIVTPPKGDDDDSKETPLPEQLRSYFKNGQLLTEVVEHAG